MPRAKTFENHYKCTCGQKIVHSLSKTKAGKHHKLQCVLCETLQRSYILFPTNVRKFEEIEA